MTGSRSLWGPNGGFVEGSLFASFRTSELGLNKSYFVLHAPSVPEDTVSSMQVMHRVSYHVYYLASVVPHSMRV